MCCVERLNPQSKAVARNALPDRGPEDRGRRVGLLAVVAIAEELRLRLTANLQRYRAAITTIFDSSHSCAAPALGRQQRNDFQRAQRAVWSRGASISNSPLSEPDPYPDRLFRSDGCAIAVVRVTVPLRVQADGVTEVYREY